LTPRAAAELINTDREAGEHLAAQPDLDRFLARYGWTGRRDRDDSEVPAVQALRARLGRIWEAADHERRAVAMVNALLADADASPWLTRHPEMPEWHLHLASQRDPLAQRMGAEFAMGLADSGGELRRLKICSAPRLQGGCYGLIPPSVTHLRDPKLRQPPTCCGLPRTARRTGNVGRRGFEPA
jgi:hypothetical protein